jgi:DNA modification methylase
MSDSVNPAGRLPGSVWSISSEPLVIPDELGIDHYAAFPMEWPRRLVTGWCPPGGVVLDPFGGTGTVKLVADALGRRGLSLDMSGDYCRLAKWRTTDPVQIAKAMQVPKPVPDPPGLQSLFDEGVFDTPVHEESA